MSNFTVKYWQIGRKTNRSELESHSFAFQGTQLKLTKAKWGSHCLRP